MEWQGIEAQALIENSTSGKGPPGGYVGEFSPCRQIPSRVKRSTIRQHANRFAHSLRTWRNLFPQPVEGCGLDPSASRLILGVLVRQVAKASGQDPKTAGILSACADQVVNRAMEILHGDKAGNG